MPHVVLKDHPHHLRKYEGKRDTSKILIFKLFSEQVKIWKGSLQQAIRKSQISISFMNCVKLGSTWTNISKPKF